MKPNIIWKLNGLNNEQRMHNYVCTLYLIRSSATSVCHSNTNCHILTCLDSCWCDLQIRILKCGIRTGKGIILELDMHSILTRYHYQLTYMQSLSKRKQWYSFKITISSVDHCTCVVCDFWNLQSKSTIDSSTAVHIL